MAIKKSRELPNGVIADHWELLRIEIDVRGNTSRVVWGLFISQAAYDGGKEAVLEESSEYDTAKFPFSAELMTSVRQESTSNSPDSLK